MNNKEVSNIIDAARNKYICDNIINPEGYYYICDVGVFKQSHLEHLISQIGYDPTECLPIYYKNYIAYLRLYPNESREINGVRKREMGIDVDVSNIKYNILPYEDIVGIATASNCSILCDHFLDYDWVTEDLVKTLYLKCKRELSKTVSIVLYNKLKTMVPVSVLAFSKEDESGIILKNIDNEKYHTKTHVVFIIGGILIDPILGYGPVDISDYVSELLKIKGMRLNYNESILNNNVDEIMEALSKI